MRLDDSCSTLGSCFDKADLLKDDADVGVEFADEEEDVDFDELAAVDAVDSPDDEAGDAAIASMLCSEAIMMAGRFLSQPP